MVTPAGANRAGGAVTSAGTAPVVLIHGVGFGPSTLAPLARVLRQHVPVVVMPRRGYGPRARLAPAATVDEHVADLLAELDRRGLERAALAGMSGGATVVLAAALAAPERVIAAVAHEPAVGSISPELRALIRRALAEGGGPQLLRFLAGERTWAALPRATVRWLAEQTPLIEADARAFADYEPRLPAASAGIPLVCSLGERSGETRRQVAQRLSLRTGAPIEVVPRCGHLPQLDAPRAFAELILNQIESERTDDDDDDRQD